MINLLADDRKSEIAAARANVFILRYIGIILLAIAFSLGALYTSYGVLESTMASADAQIASNDVKADVYSDTQAEVQALSTQLNSARAILDEEIRYSQILVAIGQVMPAGTIVGTLNLTSDNFNGIPATMTVYAASTNSASTLQTQLQSSPVFSSVSLQGTEASGGTSDYPAVITMSVTLNRSGF